MRQKEKGLGQLSGRGLVFAPRARENFLRLCRRLADLRKATAVSQLLYTRAATAKWLFHQEKATIENAGKCTFIVKPL